MTIRGYRPRVRRLLVLLLATTLTAALLGLAAFAAQPAAGAARATPRQIAYTEWTSGADFRAGTLAGVRVDHDRLLLATPVGHRTYGQQRYDVGRWVSPWTAPGFALTQLVSSWSATTPGDSWLEVQVRGRTADGTTSSWDVLGRWTSGDAFTRRTSVPGQGDDLADVNVDTWQAAQSAGLASWQLRVSLMRASGATTRSPALDTIGAMASRLPSVSSVPTSTPGPARGVELAVPRYSQMVHEGHSPRYGGGGEAWCSPTSTSMVLGYYDALPPAAAYAWSAAPRTPSAATRPSRIRTIRSKRPATASSWVTISTVTSRESIFGAMRMWPRKYSKALVPRRATNTQLRWPLWMAQPNCAAPLNWARTLCCINQSPRNVPKPASALSAP